MFVTLLILSEAKDLYILFAAEEYMVLRFVQDDKSEAAHSMRCAAHQSLSKLTLL